MKWALIGVPAIVIAGAYACGPARAVPVPPPRGTIVAAQSALLPVRYHRHYWRYPHYRYYGYWRHGHSRWARQSAPKTAAAGGVKPGRWEFTAQLQTGATPQFPAGTQLPLEA